MAGWGTTYTWRCDLVDTSNSPMTLRVSQSKICCHFLWMFNLLSSQLLSSFIFRWFKLHGCFIFQNTLNFLIPSVYYFYLYLIYIPKIFHFKVVPHVHVRLSSGFFFFFFFAGLLCTEEETKSDHISSRVPSLGHALVMVVGHHLDSWCDMLDTIIFTTFEQSSS